MGIFNRKLLVLLIFINCFNNIYIFCDNGVEVEEIRDFGKAKDSHQPIGSFNKNDKSTKESDDESTKESDGEITEESDGESTKKSDDESTQESDGEINKKSDNESSQESDDESPIDGDKHQIIEQHTTENSPIIKEEQGKITNWIKKNKILFSFLSIMTFIGGFFGIKSLVQGLSGKKNEMEGDETEGGAGKNAVLRDGIRYDDEDAELKRKQEEAEEEQSMIEEDEEELTIEEEDNNNEQKIETINLFTENITNKEILDMVQKNQSNSKTSQKLFQKYSYEYLKNTLDFTFPTQKSFDEVIKTNERSINLFFTRFKKGKDWRKFRDTDIDEQDKDLLNFYLHRDINTSNTILEYLKNQNNKIKNQNNKIYYNRKKKMLILVEDDIIKAVINQNNKFLISISYPEIKLHFNNFFLKINPACLYCSKYQILENPNQQKEYIKIINICSEYKSISLLCKFFNKDMFNSEAWKIQTYIVNQYREIAEKEREAKYKKFKEANKKKL